MLNVMTSSSSSDRSVSTVCADVEMWPQLPPIRPLTFAEQPSRFFLAAGFVSMIIHAFLVYLLCLIFADRAAFIGPAVPQSDTPLIVSLVSLPTPVSQDESGSEAASAMPNADSLAQQSQFPPDTSERSRSIEHKLQTESVPVLEDEGISGPEDSAGKSVEPDATPSTGVEAAGHITRELVRIPEFEAGLVLTRKGQGRVGSEAPPGKSFASGATPSFDLGVAGRIAEEVGSMSMTEFEFQDLRELYLMNRLGIIKTPCPDCVTPYADTETEFQSVSFGGLLAIPFLLKDIITDSGYTWYSQKRIERQLDLGRLKDQERLEFMSNIINELTFDPP